MTYGWAILIVIVVIASLYSLGVFKEPVALPDVACEYLCVSKNLKFNSFDNIDGTCVCSECETFTGEALQNIEYQACDNKTFYIELIE